MVDPITAIAAAVCMGLTALAYGYAEAHVGAAAVAIIGEDEKNFTKALILSVLPETIPILGFVVAIILLFG